MPLVRKQSPEGAATVPFSGQMRRRFNVGRAIFAGGLTASLVLSGAGVVAASTRGHHPQARPAAALTTVTMGCDTGYFGCAPYNVAISHGFFKHNGLNVVEEPITSTVAGTAALESGSLNVSLGSDALVVYSNSGTVLVNVAPSDKTYDLFGVVAGNSIQPKGKSVKDILKALEGKSIGLAGGVGSSSYYAIIGAFSAVGLPTSSAHFVNVAIGPASLASLKSGAIQAVVTDPVSETLAEQAPGLRTLVVFGRPGVLPKYLDATVTGMLTTQHYAAANRTIIERFDRAMAEADVYITNKAHLPELASAINAIIGNALTVSQSKNVAKIFLADIYQGYQSIGDLSAQLHTDEIEHTLGTTDKVASSKAFLGKFVANSVPTSQAAVLKLAK